MFQSPRSVAEVGAFKYSSVIIQASPCHSGLKKLKITFKKPFRFYSWSTWLFLTLDQRRMTAWLARKGRTILKCSWCEQMKLYCSQSKNEHRDLLTETFSLYVGRFCLPDSNPCTGRQKRGHLGSTKSAKGCCPLLTLSWGCKRYLERLNSD